MKEFHLSRDLTLPGNRKSKWRGFQVIVGMDKRAVSIVRVKQGQQR